MSFFYGRIKKNVDINAKDNFGCTPLINAAKQGHISIVQTLLKNNARVNSQDNQGNTAMIYAALNGHKNIVHMLLENGANVNVKDRNGNTFLMIIAEKGYSDIVQIMLGKVSYVLAEKDNGPTALNTAAEKNNVSRNSLKKRDVVNARKPESLLAFLSAVEKCGIAKMYAMLMRNVRLDAEHNKGKKTLIKGTRKKHYRYNTTAVTKRYSANNSRNIRIFWLP